MNLPNKLTLSRIILSFVIIFILLFPLDAAGIELPRLFVDETIVIELRYIIAGVLFIVASLTDFLDGYIARKYNLVTDFGKMLDSIADKVLVNSVLIILAASGFISPIIPVVIIVRDSIVNSIKMIAGNKGEVVAAIYTGKIKAACLMVGIVLTLFYNLPFEIWNIHLGLFLVYFATLMSVISGIQYWRLNKNIIITDE